MAAPTAIGPGPRRARWHDPSLLLLVLLLLLAILVVVLLALALGRDPRLPVRGIMTSRRAAMAPSSGTAPVARGALGLEPA